MMSRSDDRCLGDVPQKEGPICLGVDGLIFEFGCTGRWEQRWSSVVACGDWQNRKAGKTLVVAFSIGRLCAPQSTEHEGYQPFVSRDEFTRVESDVA